ncbi:MMPL family transporter [Dactylosporangium sp. CA-152071]|uniref:MMPL family transporter n=1 Tax=Dactylosporangium sp. CA-152071 TaxID=3239933 RepID=UPI003D8A7729
MGLGSLAGKLTDAQQNDTAAWLPSDAQATKVSELQKQFQATDEFPAVILYERSAGTTDADLAKVKDDATKLAGVDGVSGPVQGPIASDDHQALQIIVPIEMGPVGQLKVVERVDAIRAIVLNNNNGLNAYVTGPMGFAADNTEAFEGIDTTLLMATVAVVIILLLVIYRSPILWLLPVISAGLTLVIAQAVVYLLADGGGLVVNSQSVAILTVLVFGIGTDYALLLISRYREELRTHEDRHEAMGIALRRSGPALLASAATVAVGMLCLLLADMNSTKGLGPVAAVGVVIALAAMMTLFPALLVIFGRWIFWPSRPKFGSSRPSDRGGWAKLGERIAKRPRAVWAGTALVLAVMTIGLTQLNANGLPFEESFLDQPPSVTGQKLINQHFAGGAGQPLIVIGKASAASGIQDALKSTEGIAAVGDPLVKGDLVRIEGTLRDEPGTAAADKAIDRARDAVAKVPGADANIGGFAAITHDTNVANSADTKVVIPLVLLAVLLILMLVLRAVVAPVVLIGTVVLSFAAALGFSAFVFKYVFGFNASDSGFPLYIFVFLVAVGIDYNIFLVTRIREETVRHGTRKGALIGLSATGGVITSAGLVLAATFAVLTTLPLVLIVEMGFAIAIGILLDTFVVRSILATALTLDIGPKMWWPSSLATESKPVAPAVDRDLDPEPV